MDDSSALNFVIFSCFFLQKSCFHEEKKRKIKYPCLYFCYFTFDAVYAIDRIQSNRSNFDIRGYLGNTTKQKTLWIDQKF